MAPLKCDNGSLVFDDEKKATYWTKYRLDMTPVQSGLMVLRHGCRLMKQIHWIQT